MTLLEAFTGNSAYDRGAAGAGEFNAMATTADTQFGTAAKWSGKSIASALVKYFFVATGWNGQRCIRFIICAVITMSA
jgi:hypothetical protein